MAPMLLLSLLHLLLVSGARTFNLSNTLGSGMVLQRAPKSAVVWGMGRPGVAITTTFMGRALKPAVVRTNGFWRQRLPPTAASKVPTTITFSGSDGGKAKLTDVLFGDVFLCGGQSNMQYTPRSSTSYAAHMNNMTAELAAADSYGASLRFFTAGMESVCGTPGATNSGSALPSADCSRPWPQLQPNVSVSASNWTQNGTEKQFINGSWHTEACEGACREPWMRASARTLGAQAWNTFSAVCYLTGRDIHDRLGGEVPIGLISSNWGGTPIESWLPAAAIKACGRDEEFGPLYNSMIAPFAVGPMALTGFTWYQGEGNIIGASDASSIAKDYACTFPALIEGWRNEFNDSELWFGFVQVAGYSYAGSINCTDSDPPDTNASCPDTHHSLAAADLRQAQLAALQLPNVGFSTTIDTGDYTNIHPPDKQTPSRRLASQALKQIYKANVSGAEFPFYAGSKLSTTGAVVTVTVAIRAGRAKTKVQLTTTAPLAATQSTRLGQPGSLPRNKCVTMATQRYHYPPRVAPTFPEYCGYPQIWGVFANGSTLALNASAAIGADGSSLVLSATAPAGFKATSSSYGRATWPMTVFFSSTGLPVIPWWASLNATEPWQSPGFGTGSATPPSAANEAFFPNSYASKPTRHDQPGW